MFDLETIRAMSAEAGTKAKRGRLIPHIPRNVGEVDTWPPFPFPNFGTYCPKGWVKREDAEWFCDSSGFGAPGEPALTIEQFKAALREHITQYPGDGYAIVEVGQFQCYVAVFRLTGKTAFVAKV